MGFLDSLGTAKATGVAILIWMLGLLLVFAAANELRIKSDDRTRANLLEGVKPRRLVVREDEVSTKEYETVMETLSSIHLDVQFNQPGTKRRPESGIAIAISDVSQYYTYIIVLYDIMTAIPDARWRFERMCAGIDCGQIPYSATLKAYRKKSQLAG